MLSTPQPRGNVVVPIPSVPLRYFITSKARMLIISKEFKLPLMFIRKFKARIATISKVLTRFSPPFNPMVMLLCPFPVFPLMYFITSKASMPTISKELTQFSINPTLLIIVLFYLDMFGGVKGGYAGENH